MSITTKVYGQSLGEHPLWPNRRGIDEIGELHEVNTKATLQFCPNIKNWEQTIEENAVVVDWGCGEGEFVQQLSKKRPDLRFIGVSMHDVRKDVMEGGVFSHIYYGQMPKELTFLEHWKGRVSAMIDTYGPMSWMDNPVDGLIYAALCLKAGGVFSSITSETNKEKSQSVFGGEANWGKIKKFMAEHLKVDLVIIPSKIKSQVFQATIQRDYIVKMHKTESVHYSASEFTELCVKAAKEIGTPVQGAVWWAPETKDGDLAIRAKQW